MKLRFTPRATQDLVDIADYIRERSPNASLRVRAAILDSLQDLVLFPEAGRRQAIEGVRKFVTRKYSYLIYYGLGPKFRRDHYSHHPALGARTRV
jgi:toxin ParE1/3/4